MKSFIIPIHSFVDVITNSSSEVFVTASKKSVETVKDILKLFLENANVATPVDEIFEVVLVYDRGSKRDEVVTEDFDEEYDEYGPKNIRVSVKEGHTQNYGKLVNLMNELNCAFIGQEFPN